MSKARTLEETLAMKTRTATITRLALALALALLPVTAAFAQAQGPTPTGGGVTVPIAGTIGATGAQPGTLTGTFTVQRFAQQGGNLVAIGTLVGTFTDAATQAPRTVVSQVALPAQVTGSCPILHLDLGPLDLNLLGLVVHLNEVVLDITAQSGPGNLLGNLLCAVANLLNGTGGTTGPLSQIVALLNQILAALG
jgi:hypothetical protein